MDQAFMCTRCYNIIKGSISCSLDNKTKNKTMRIESVYACITAKCPNCKDSPEHVAMDPLISEPVSILNQNHLYTDMSSDAHVQVAYKNKKYNCEIINMPFISIMPRHCQNYQGIYRREISKDLFNAFLNAGFKNVLLDGHIELPSAEIEDYDIIKQANSIRFAVKSDIDINAYAKIISEKFKYDDPEKQIDNVKLNIERLINACTKNLVLELKEILYSR